MGFGAGVVKAENMPPGVCGLGGKPGSGLVSLRINGMLPVGPFVISKDWLAQGRAVSPQPGRFFFNILIQFFF